MMSPFQPVFGARTEETTMARFYNPYYGGLLNGTDEDEFFDDES